MNKNYDYKRLTPFKWFVLQNFPFIDEDFDAITNYQLFCKLGEEINKVIESMNLAGQQVEELTNFVNNYFDNLDVQEEINNKLDEMAEQGQLTDIIAQYLQLAGLLCFNTKSDMKNAENLANGSFAKTYGTTTYNDGYGEFYKIREILNTDVVDDNNIIALTNYNNLIAEKIPNDFERAQTIARDTLFESIEDAFEECIEKNYILYLTQDYNITLTEDINIPSIIGNNHTITTTGMNARFLINNKKIENVIFESISSAQSNKCLELNNGEIKNCEFYNYILPIKCIGNSKNIIINCYTYNCAQGVYGRESNNLNINNFNYINNETQRNYYISNLSNIKGIDGVLLELCNNVKIENSSFEFCIERVLYSGDSENVQFNNNYMKNTNGIKFVGYTKICNNFNANNNIMYNSYDDAFCQLYECNNINLTNNKFDCEDEPYCIGWVVRAGHTVRNVNITGNDMNFIKRNIFHWLDTFPDTVSKDSYILQNINISNNNFKNLGLISQLHYPAISIEDKTTDGTYNTNNIEINNNTIYSRNYDSSSTFSQGNKSMKNLFYCHHANNVNIFNNNVKGIYDTILPGIDTEGSTNVNGNLNVYAKSNGTLMKQFNPINGNFNVKVIYNGSDVNGCANYNINNNNIICDMNIKETNKPLFIQFANNYNIQVNSFNKGESANLYYDGTNVYAEGTGAKTSLTGDQTDIFLYMDNGTPILRVRGNNEHNYKILFSFSI